MCRVGPLHTYTQEIIKSLLTVTAHIWTWIDFVTAIQGEPLDYFDHMNILQWSLTYPDTYVPKVIVCINEFPDKWITL